MKQLNNMKTLSKLIGGAVFAGMTGAVVYWLATGSPFTRRLSAATLPQLKVQETGIARDTKTATSFSPVVKRVGPAVVNIYTTKTIKQTTRGSSPFDDPLFRRFFGDPSDEELPYGGRQRRGYRSPQPKEREEHSLGSGVIVSPDGYILTNNHVVDGADEIKVALADGKKEFEAKVIGTDPQTEIAVLKIEAQDLPTVTLTDSDKLEVGDVVLAIGSPFGLRQTVTMGIISGMGRGGFGITEYEDFIQTDASINPGNSGGALVDAEGRLVGINTWIMSRTGGNQGVGFAVPVNMARSVMERLIRDGKVTRGFLGVIIQPVTPELAKQFKLPAEQSGALVGEVNPKTPAAEAGLKEGDIVTEFNGKKVSDARHFRLMVSQTAPQTKATLKLIRDGKEKTLTATLGTLPGQDDAKGMRKSGGDSKETGDETLDGVEVSDLDNRTRRETGIPQTIRGVVITEIDPDSPCYRAGLRVGDVILEINRKPVKSADDAVEMSKGIKDSVLLRVWSNKSGRGEGSSSYVTVEPPKKRK